MREIWRKWRTFAMIFLTVAVCLLTVASVSSTWVDGYVEQRIQEKSEAMLYDELHRISPKPENLSDIPAVKEYLVECLRFGSDYSMSNYSNMTMEEKSQFINESFAHHISSYWGYSICKVLDDYDLAKRITDYDNGFIYIWSVFMFFFAGVCYSYSDHLRGIEFSRRAKEGLGVEEKEEVSRKRIIWYVVILALFLISAISIIAGEIGV